jgi:nicotinate dehydrogenase subunit A
LISAAALLQRQAHPTRQEIVQALDGNLCRCGAHNRVIRAIEKVATQSAAL